MKFRFHRGALDDSMETMIEVAPIDGSVRAGLLAAIRKEYAALGPDFADGQLRVAPYFGDDDRIGWKDVHIVSIDGYGVVGFCEGPA